MTKNPCDECSMFKMCGACPLTTGCAEWKHWYVENWNKKIHQYEKVKAKHKPKRNVFVYLSPSEMQKAKRISVCIKPGNCWWCDDKCEAYRNLTNEGGENDE